MLGRDGRTRELGGNKPKRTDSNYQSPKPALALAPKPSSKWREGDASPQFEVATPADASIVIHPKWWSDASSSSSAGGSSASSKSLLSQTGSVRPKPDAFHSVYFKADCVVVCVASSTSKHAIGSTALTGTQHNPPSSHTFAQSQASASAVVLPLNSMPYPLLYPYLSADGSSVLYSPIPTLLWPTPAAPTALPLSTATAAPAVHAAPASLPAAEQLFGPRSTASTNNNQTQTQTHTSTSNGSSSASSSSSAPTQTKAAPAPKPKAPVKASVRFDVDTTTSAKKTSDKSSDKGSAKAGAQPQPQLYVPQSQRTVRPPKRTCVRLLNVLMINSMCADVLWCVIRCQ
jgi:hypothetical protein